jgi:hypothetical protein
MAIIGKQGGSRSIAFMAVFAAMIAALDSTPMIPGFYSGVWDSWVFILSPIVGILLGPVLGAIAVGLGSLVGHLVYFRDPLELIFMLGAPVGAGMAGLVYQQRWRSAFIIYSLLLLGYFITPVTWQLSLWGIWDVLVGFTLIFGITTVSSFKKSLAGLLSSTTFRLVFGAVIGLESDILVRIFILIPCQTYWFFYGLPVEELQLMWLIAGFITPLKVVLAAIATVAIGKPIIRQFQEINNDSASELTTDR